MSRSTRLPSSSKAPGGPEEQAEQAHSDGDHGYKAALLSTLKRTRQLLEDGSL